MGSTVQRTTRTCHCSTFYKVSMRYSRHELCRSNEECCCGDDERYCVCPQYCCTDGSNDCPDCYIEICECTTYYVSRGARGKDYLYRSNEECCCTCGGDICVCPPYRDKNSESLRRTCSCETFYVVEDCRRKSKFTHYRSDRKCCCRDGRYYCVCPPHRDRDSMRCDCCFRRTCGCSTFYTLQRDHAGGIEGHVHHRSNASCCCTCGGDYCVCPPYKDLSELEGERKQGSNSTLGSGRHQDRDHVKQASSSPTERATPSAPPMPGDHVLRDEVPSGSRRIPEVNIRMPDGNITHITEPNRTDCTCSARADTVQLPLRPDGKMSAREYQIVKTQVTSTMVRHRNNIGGHYSRFEIVDIFKVKNCCLFKRYKNCQLELVKEVGAANVVERMLFHGSTKPFDIVNKGFDERYSRQGGYFGAGIYFARHSSKSNQYVFGYKGGQGCSAHKSNSCYTCKRQLLMCRVLLGKIDKRTTPDKMSHAPQGFHSVMGVPSPGYLQHPEYVIYKGEQAYPEYLISYKLVN